MWKRIGILLVGDFLILALLMGFFGAKESFAQQENKAALVADQFLQAVVQGDSPSAFELCTSGLRRGKTAEDFLESPEIATIFSGTKSWEIIGVLGKGSIKTVVLKLTNTEGANEKFRALGIACLKMRGSYRLRDFSITPWVTSKARFLRYLSDLYTRLDDIDSAEQTITKAFALDPKDPKVSAFLGYIYLEKGIKLEEAKRLIQSAHKQDPEDPEFMDFMGWAFHKANQRQNSVQWFDRAREAFQKIEGYRSSPEYIRFSTHVHKAKAKGWKPTQT
jgi:tetratricopeptide (TPR) repeat protein